MRALLPAFAALLTAGCATTPEAHPTPPAPEARTCNAEAAHGHIGHHAAAGMGAAILRDSGAQSLRWGPPNSAWTMDYRKDRVNVRYDENMKITEITCG